MLLAYTLNPDRSDSKRIIISHLLSQIQLVRTQLITYTADLLPAELDIRIGAGFNSIGTILKHIAANEYVYQLTTFEGRATDEKEKEFWRGASTGELILNLINGNDIEYYHNLLNTVRSKSIENLLAKNDEWLYANTAYKFDSPVNNYYCWFHVMEDEISHLGQIKILKNQIRNLQQKHL